MKNLTLQKSILLLFPILSASALLFLFMTPVLKDEEQHAHKSQFAHQSHKIKLASYKTAAASKRHKNASALTKINDPLIKVAKNTRSKNRPDTKLQKLTEAHLQRRNKNKQARAVSIKDGRRVTLRPSLAGSKQKNKNPSTTSANNSITTQNGLTDKDSELDQTNDADEEADEEDEDVPELGPTIETVVTAKVMSRKNRKGLPGVEVTILVFHPLSSVSASPVWIVPVQARTDKNGLFSLALQVPEDPVSGAVLGLAFSHPSHQALAGVPITKLIAGNSQSLGIFWLGNNSNTLQGSMTPSFLAEQGHIIDTGGLNPLAWDYRIRDSILQLFPTYSIRRDEQASNVDGYAFPITRQDSDQNGQRWVSLIRKGAWLGSQSVRWKKVKVDENGQVKTRIIGFADFILGPDSSLNGSVTADNGGALSGAIVTALTQRSEPSQTSLSGANGSFRFSKPPTTLRAFQVSHQEYLTQEFAAGSSASHPVLVLQTRRPNIPLFLTDSLSGEALSDVKVTLRAVKVKGKATQQQALQLKSPSGSYQLTAAFPIGEILFEREGYFQKLLVAPDNYPPQALAVPMVEARTLLLTARQAINKSSRWSELDKSSYVTYWSQKWLDFEIDYGVEAAAFDFEIGVRNHGIIDHKYKFDVRIDLKGAKSQRVHIIASQTNTQTVRVKLPARADVQRVRITWLNDRYIPKQLDANIIVDWVKFHQRPLTAAEKAQFTAAVPQ
jgi:hypothetical protein